MRWIKLYSGRWQNQWLGFHVKYYDIHSAWNDSTCGNSLHCVSSLCRLPSAPHNVSVSWLLLTRPERSDKAHAINTKWTHFILKWVKPWVSCGQWFSHHRWWLCTIAPVMDSQRWHTQPQAYGAIVQCRTMNSFWRIDFLYSRYCIIFNWKSAVIEINWNGMLNGRCLSLTMAEKPIYETKRVPVDVHWDCRQ